MNPTRNTSPHPSASGFKKSSEGSESSKKNVDFGFTQTNHKENYNAKMHRIYERIAMNPYRHTKYIDSFKNLSTDPSSSDKTSGSETKEIDVPQGMKQYSKEEAYKIALNEYQKSSSDKVDMSGLICATRMPDVQIVKGTLSELAYSAQTVFTGESGSKQLNAVYQYMFLNGEMYLPATPENIKMMTDREYHPETIFTEMKGDPIHRLCQATFDANKITGIDTRNMAANLAVNIYNNATTKTENKIEELQKLIEECLDTEHFLINGAIGAAHQTINNVRNYIDTTGTKTASAYLTNKGEADSSAAEKTEPTQGYAPKTSDRVNSLLGSIFGKTSKNEERSVSNDRHSVSPPSRSVSNDRHSASPPSKSEENSAESALSSFATDLQQQLDQEGDGGGVSGGGWGGNY